jgi:hypothetical protein
MHIFAIQPKATQHTRPFPSTTPSRAYLGQNRDVSEANTRHFDFVRIPVEAPSIQRKPTISSPGDVFEREADDVADRVMRMVDATAVGSAPAAIQRKCAECKEEEESGAAQHAPSADLQSIEGGEEESEFTAMAVQRKAEFGAAATARPAAVDRLVGTQSGGELLAAGTRHRMETAFGWDFSRVRVHRDRDAAELSHQLRALAFTYGSHIYFGSGRYDPEGSSGKHLLAHELAHVVQQGQAALRYGDAAPVATAVQTTSLAIQRVATWAPAAVHETNNLANMALDGVLAGVTTPMFNGAIGGALKGPKLKVTPAARSGFDATVDTVPTNTGSVDEKVLAPGPWTRVVPKATIGARFPTLAQCTEAGNSNFRARGDPSDAAMFAANRRHEDHHEADRHAAFSGSVVKWDTKLTNANTAGTSFHGPTAAGARAVLFAEMGGTVDEVTAACTTAGAAARDAFHASKAGGRVGPPTDPTAAADCSWSFARYTNPS